MKEVKIPQTIKIGGFDYKIILDTRTTQTLNADGQWGKCNSQLRELLLSGDAFPQQFSATFLHETIHAISDVYLSRRDLLEEQVSALAQGLLQVLEQLGIRFVRGD